RSPGPSALIKTLIEADATRAPLHPLLLQGWIALFGPSDLSARALSALLGVLTVPLVYRVGREAFDEPTALWGAALAAISPYLVRYSQEVRMYALLVPMTCICWEILLSFRHSAPIWKQGIYVLALTALIYTQPLGFLMVAAL